MARNKNASLLTLDLRHCMSLICTLFCGQLTMKLLHRFSVKITINWSRAKNKSKQFWLVIVRISETARKTKIDQNLLVLPTDSASNSSVRHFSNSGSRLVCCRFDHSWCNESSPGSNKTASEALEWHVDTDEHAWTLEYQSYLGGPSF